jgi:hypothetical protein
VEKNLENFQTITDAHNLHTRCKHDLHVPNLNLTKCQGGVHIIAINLFSNLPPTNGSLNHDTHVFKPTLRYYILTKSIYYVDGFIPIEKF